MSKTKISRRIALSVAILLAAVGALLTAPSSPVGVDLAGGLGCCRV